MTAPRSLRPLLVARCAAQASTATTTSSGAVSCARGAPAIVRRAKRCPNPAKRTDRTTTSRATYSSAVVHGARPRVLAAPRARVPVPTGHGGGIRAVRPVVLVPTAPATDAVATVAVVLGRLL